MENRRKIVQIVPAAAEDVARLQSETGTSRHVKIQLWALVESAASGPPAVVGMSGEGDKVMLCVDELPHFAEYVRGAPDKFMQES